MALLLVLAAIFYVERTTFIDNPFQIFLMIQDQSIEVMAGRYPSVVVRVLPYLVMKMGGDISAIMMAFSLSYMIFHAIIYYAIAYILKNPRIALLIPAMMCVAVTDGFYWCNSELIQGCSVAILAISVYISDLAKVKKLSLTIVGIILAIFFHPLSIVVLTFMISYEIRWDKIKIIDFLLLAISLLIFFGKSLLLPNWYDTAKRQEVTTHWEQYSGDIFNIPSLRMFGSQMMDTYWMLAVLLILGIILLIKTKQYYRLILTLSAIGAYTILVHLSDPLAPYAFYIEVNYTPLIVILMWALLRTSTAKYSKLILALLAILMILGSIRISLRSEYYTSRYNWYVDTLTSLTGDYYYMSSSIAPMPLIHMIWASPYESLIITSREGQSKTLLITDDQQSIIKTSPSSFIGSFKQYSIPNSDYFDLSKEEYQEIK